MLQLKSVSIKYTWIGRIKMFLPILIWMDAGEFSRRNAIYLVICLLFMCNWSKYTDMENGCTPKSHNKKVHLSTFWMELNELNQLSFASTCAWFQAASVLLCWLRFIFFFSLCSRRVTNSCISVVCSQIVAVHLIKNQFEKFCVLHMCHRILLLAYFLPYSILPSWFTFTKQNKSMAAMRRQDNNGNGNTIHTQAHKKKILV